MLQIMIKINRILSGIKPILPPLFLAVFPALFLYSNNATILTLPSLLRILLLNLAEVIVIYITYMVFMRGRALQAANGTFMFLIFFNTYGIVYRFLIKLDIIQVEHYTFLPLFILVAIYASWLITKVNQPYPTRLWNAFTVVMGVLVVYNLFSIIPREIKKANQIINVSSISANQIPLTNHVYPDIYYVVLDEFAGLEAMRAYWHNYAVNNFKEFLNTNGFAVTENSHAGTIDTLQIMASRLNYEEYPLGHDYVDSYYTDIADNKVMRYLKSLGYQTIVFDETKASFAYPAAKPIIADYSFEFDPNNADNIGILFDDYGVMVADNTMFYAFSDLYKINNPVLEKHRNMIYFTVNKVSNLGVPSPVFVYIHLMLPHMPFMFDENGNITDTSMHQNWNYYLGNYIFATNMLEKLVSNILAKSDTAHPKVIILQSDHGARNLKTSNPYSVILENYPEEYKTLILNALRLPGCDISNLPQNVDPINTFPIVFNCYFDAKIPLQ